MLPVTGWYAMYDYSYFLFVIVLVSLPVHILERCVYYYTCVYAVREVIDVSCTCAHMLICMNRYRFYRRKNVGLHDIRLCTISYREYSSLTYTVLIITS